MNDEDGYFDERIAARPDDYEGREEYSDRFSEDGSTIEGAWEINHDRKTWEKDFDLTYRRIS